MDPIDKKLPKKPPNQVVKGKKIPIILNPEIKENTLGEAKEFVIGPQTSNRTLGQLKSRLDHVGAAARMELRRRGRLNQDQSSLHDYLSGKKEIDAHASQTLAKAGKKSKLTVYDVIKAKQREAELKAEIARRKNRAAQARFKSRKKKAEATQILARQETLNSFRDSLPKPMWHGSIAAHLQTRELPSEVQDAAYHEYQRTSKELHKQALRLDSLYRTIKQPKSKRAQAIQQRIDNFIAHSAPFWSHMAGTALRTSALKGEQSMVKQASKSHVYGKIVSLHNRIQEGRKTAKLMADQRDKFGSHLSDDEAFYVTNHDGKPIIQKHKIGLTPNARLATSHEVEAHFKEEEQRAKENENTAPPPNATVPVPSQPSLTGKLAHFLKRGRLTEEHSSRIAKRILETQHQELVRLINAKKS